MRFVEIALAHDAGTWAAMPITRAVRTPNQTWSGARWFCARARRSSRARRSPTTKGGNISTSFSNRPDANAPSAWRDGASGAARRRHDDAPTRTAVAAWRRDHRLRLRGRLRRLVLANSRSCRSLIVSTISREAPLRLAFERPPRLAASAAPAAICCFFDLAGMKSSWQPTSGAGLKAASVPRKMCTGAEGSASHLHVERLSCRRLDRRRAVPPALRQAVVELALLEHGIGEPNPAAHHDDEEKQQERVGDPAIARGLHVVVAFGRFRLVHDLIVASMVNAKQPSSGADRAAYSTSPRARGEV